MNILKLKEKLRSAPPEAEVVFDFGGCSPTTVDSWRGIYAEAALGWDKTYPRITAAALLNELEKATSGETYYGWKGGEYQYDDSTDIHVDNPGEYTNTEITHITIEGEWRVMLHTEHRD